MLVEGAVARWWYSYNGRGGRSDCDGDGDAVVEVGRPW